MNKFEHIYEPAQDSQLLLKKSLEEVNKINQLNNKKLKICEVGVGSGFVISNIAKKYPNNLYFGTDINSYAIDFTLYEFGKIGVDINLKNCSLFGVASEKFDMILFNTPYLPCEDGEVLDDLNIKDMAIYGGERGYEVIVDFIYNINDRLKNDGCVLMLFSSLSNLKYIEDVLALNLFEFEILEETSAFFETMYAMKIVKSDILKKISLHCSKIKYLAKGKHSIVMQGIYNLRKCIIKIGKFDDIQIENLFLKKLKGENFMPELYFDGGSFCVREFLHGEIIKEFLDVENDRDKIIDVLNKILIITQRFDELGINKFEMTNPYKHIYVDEKNGKLDVMFIDFERCIYTNKPKNTTQVLQYFRRNVPILKEKGINIDEVKIMAISKSYKKKMFIIKFDDIIC